MATGGTAIFTPNLRQTPQSDLVIGTQAPFWENTSGQFTGLTVVRRWGFTPPLTLDNLGGGFSPSQRLASSQVRRSITGYAPPVPWYVWSLAIAGKF